MTNHRLISAFMMTIGVATLTAQAPPTTARLAAVTDSTRSAGGCPGGNGLHISVTSGDGSGDINRVIDDRQSLDTTIVFNVAQKSWTRTNLAAAITAGLADQSRGGYAICAGVTALMPTATLTIKGARGRVHFAATLQNLLNAIRSGTGAITPPPRRL
jgi:hypothetical protein